MTLAEIRILVDHLQRKVRSHLKMTLEAAGYRVDATDDHQEILARCRKHVYQIVFVDVNMSSLNGLDLIRAIKALSKHSTVAILSRHGVITKVVEGMKLGAVDFIEEPIDGTKILLLCEEILRRRALMTHDTVDELLHFAELALERNAMIEARAFLKMAILRDENRAEPYYWLSEIYETQGDMREALHYYCRALDAGPAFQPSCKALFRLKQLASVTRAENKKIA